MSDKIRFKYWQTYGIFFLFGAGNSWFVVTMIFMQLPIYQEYFSLTLSNRMAIGYNMGSVSAGLLVLLKWLRPHFAEKNNHLKYIIIFCFLIQMMCAFTMCICVPGSPLFSENAIVFMQFLAGSVGYLSNVSSVPYLMKFENHLVTAYLAGDSASSLYATLLTVLQQPGAEQPNFSILVYSFLCLPIVPLSLTAFLYIDHTQKGMILDVSANTNSILKENIEMDDFKGSKIIRSSSDEQNENMTKRNDTSKMCNILTSVSQATEQHLIQPNLNIPKLDSNKEIDDYENDETKSLMYQNDTMDKPKPSEYGGLMPIFLINAVKKNGFLRNSFTWKCLFLIFWSQSLDWGMGDSIYPYACNNSDVRKEKCEMLCNQMSMVTKFFGSALASFFTYDLNHLTLKLWLPMVIYTIFFILLLILSISDQSIRGKEVVSFKYVIISISMLRFLGPYGRAIAVRLIQPAYDKKLHKTISVFFGMFGMFSNIIGAVIATILIGFNMF